MARPSKVAVKDIKLEQALYPRDTDIRSLVDRYLTALDKLPPIVITKDNILVDGWHRLSAYRQAGEEFIMAIVVDISDPREIIEMALELNSKSGQQLNMKEKKRWIKQLFEEGTEVNRICEILSVSEQWVRRVTEPERREERQERNQKIRDLAEKGLTQEQITEKLEDDGIEISQQSVSRILTTQNETGFETSNEEGLRWPKMEPFNIWYFHLQSKEYDVAKQHKWGQVDPQVLEHMLYFFTEENDMIVDPMAGTGILGDVCDRYNRQCLLYDIEVFNSRVIQNDIWDGLPYEAHGCDHMILEPPYFNLLQEGAFNDDPEVFYLFIEQLCVLANKNVKEGGYIFFIMSDKHKGGFEPMKERCFAILDKWFEPVSSISIPLPPQNHPGMGARIIQARMNRDIIGRDRSLYVFRKVKAQ